MCVCACVCSCVCVYLLRITESPDHIKLSPQTIKQHAAVMMQIVEVLDSVPVHTKDLWYLSGEVCCCCVVVRYHVECNNR